MITDRQTRLLRQKRMEGKTQETAAAKAGMSVRSARKWQSGPLPSPGKPEQREYALRRPRAFVRERARALGISDPVVGLITGLDHDRIQVATYAEGAT